MSFRQKLVKEFRVVVVTTVYFAVWFGLLVLLKRLYLADYQIQFRGLSLALVGALVVAKVVLLMEHVSLGEWIRNHAVAVDVILRTFLEALGVAVVLLLERGFEARQEHGGFVPGVTWVFQHRDMHHVWADTIGVSGALLGFNFVSAIRQHLGEGRLHRLFLSPPVEGLKTQARDETAKGT
jgi:hypothetical protein